MGTFDVEQQSFTGPRGTLRVSQDDELALKLLMLIEGQCALGASKAAAKYGYSKQRYSQLLQQFKEQGASALTSRKRGPKTNYRRTPEVERQVIRHRFLDPEASAKVIAQRLRQTGVQISTRSVERIIAEYGLQKKTPSVQSAVPDR